MDYVYLWVDGIHVNIRLEEHRLCLLVMIGVHADGRKELVALTDGYRESVESWADLLRDCARRGMRAPVLATAPAMPPATAPSAARAPVSTWDKVAQCESGGNWATSTGNGFHGGRGCTASTWRSFGGSGMPHQASRTEQIAVAERVLAAQGWKAWPACSHKLGLR